MDKISIAAFGAPNFEEPIYRQSGDVSYTIFKRVPVQRIVDGTQWVINTVFENSQSFISEEVKDIMRSFGVVKIFTNIDVDVITPENVYQVYDILDAAGVFEDVANTVEARQKEFYMRGVNRTLENIMAYKNSAVGIVDALSSGAKESTANMQENLDFLKDEGSLSFVRQLLENAQALGMPVS